MTDWFPIGKKSPGFTHGRIKAVLSSGDQACRRIWVNIPRSKLRRAANALLGNGNILVSVCLSVSGLNSAGALQQRLLIIRRLLLLLLLLWRRRRGLRRRSHHGIGHRGHAGAVIGRHVHGHSRLRCVVSSRSLVHVLSVHPAAVKKIRVNIETQPVQTVRSR